MRDLSIIIPSRNEEFLVRTIEDILSHIEGNTEIIVVLDGWTVDLPKDERVRSIHFPESIGQRAGTNRAVELSDAKYVMKVDAHCAFDQGFDRKLMAKMEDNYTMVPVMRNLHVFDWVCPDGHRRYQSPSGPCKECGKETIKDIVWIPKVNPQSSSYCFDEEPHFQYFNAHKKTQKYKDELPTGLTETLSLQGSAFLLTREKYWELNICDESLGSWGSQGIEVAVKTWLSGGRVVVNHDTWYAHLFRTQGGDFGFPYDNPYAKVQHAKQTVKELFFDNKWDKQVRPLSWLIERFWPVQGWSEDARNKLRGWPILGKTKGIVYYTDNHVNMKLARAVRSEIQKSGLPITSVSRKPTDFGRNIVMPGEGSSAKMFRQILKGLEEAKEDIIFLCEDDVFYHQNHFDFTPTDHKFYYNGNYWMLRLEDGFAVKYNVSPLSGLVGYREDLIAHFRERVEMIEKEGFSYHMGFEPFTHKRIPWKTWFEMELFFPENPNVDVAHGNNQTHRKWSPEKFRKKPTFWEESDIDHIPSWDIKSMVK